MKKYTFILIIILRFYCSYCQQNLVPNPSFENYSNCPQNCNINNLLSNWVNPTFFTPDYLNTCVTNSICGIPFNFYGSQTAQDGNGYVGIITGKKSSPSAEAREYVQVMLTANLQANIAYLVSLNVSVADSVKYIANSVGCHFSTNPVSSNDIHTLPYSAQVNFTTLDHNTSKTNWIALTGSFVAQGGENYITIGNFLNDNTTILDSFPNVGNYLGGHSYLYIDNISVTPLTTGFMENTNDFFFSCIPTIATDIINVSSGRDIKKIKLISVYGSTIMEIQGCFKNTTLDVSTINNGIYYLEAEFGGIKQKKKLIIDR